MRTELHWIDAPLAGRLAIMPRPRGGDWLEDEIQACRRSGVAVVVSLLTREEEAELNLADEETLCQKFGLEFVSFPIVDRAVPSSSRVFADLIGKLVEQLAGGKNVAIHCRQGIGRAALVAICVLVMTGIEPTAAIDKVSKARGCAVPETADQRRWISDYAKSLVVTIPS